MKKTPVFFLFSLALFVLVSSVAFGGQLPLNKGPYLLLEGEQWIVRVEEKDLKEPRLEWEGPGGISNRPLERETNRFWKAVLPQGIQSFRYRLVDGEDATDWIQLDLPSITAPKLTFAVYGDNRTGGGDSAIHQDLLDAIKKEKPAFILGTGDIVYRGNMEEHWQQFFDEGRDIFLSFPFLPAIGNHDRSRDDRFGKLFPLGKKGQNYYGFKYGPAYFIALDTTVPFEPDSAQYKFLKAKLEENYNNMPIIVYFHNSPFSGGKHGSDSKIIRHLVPLFEDYGVDIVITGHDHNYQRIGPINGVPYIVTGGGGGPLYRVAAHPAIINFKVRFHYMLIELEGDIIRASVKTKNGIVIDSFELTHSAAPLPKDQRKAYPKIGSSRFRLFN